MEDQFGIEVARSTASELKEKYGGYIVRGLEGYRHAIKEGYFFFEVTLSGSYTRASRERAHEVAQYTEQGEWDVGQLLAVPDPYPSNPPTTTYYHASPAMNVDEIEEDGLLPSTAEECRQCDLDRGIYITRMIRAAEEWAHLMKEEGWAGRGAISRWVLLALSVPDSLPIVEDITPMKVTPQSYIVCTSFGLPPRFITVVRTVEIH